MGMKIKNQIINKLDKLEGYAEILSTAAGLAEEDFVKNPLIFGGANRYILLGLHDVSDVSTMLCEEFCLEHSESCRVLLRTLSEKKVFPAWLAESLSTNINYFAQKQFDDFGDETKLYGELNKIVSDFRHFKKYVLEYLI